MVIDSSALLAILFEEKEQDVFLELILAADRRLMSAATLVETSMVALGADQAFEDGLNRLVVELNIDFVPFSVDQAAYARDAFFRFGKGRHRAKLNLGDCFTYALARDTGEPLLFKGNDFSKTDILPAV